MPHDAHDADDADHTSSSAASPATQVRSTASDLAHDGPAVVFASMIYLVLRRNGMRVLLLTSALSLVVLSGVAADKASDAVKAAEKAWASATVAGDEAALKELLSDDLSYTHSNGETDTKAVFIQNLKTGARKYHKLHHESMDVRLYGDTAVLTATAQVETSQKGGKVHPVHLRFIHVWVMKNGRWQMAAHQSLRLPN
jgi:ketosteroid isomerase-like protein